MISRELAEEITDRFLLVYPAPRRELLFRYGANMNELYGSRDQEFSASIKGGFSAGLFVFRGKPYQGCLDISLSNIADTHDLLQTLRHEVIGHYGLNTFERHEKQAIIDAIQTTRHQQGISRLWDEAEHLYPDLPAHEQAEEVFGIACEDVHWTDHMGNDQIHRNGIRSFMETCIERTRPMQARDLRNLVLMVAQGIHDQTRKLQNFQQKTQFRVEDDLSEPEAFHNRLSEKLTAQLKAGNAPWQRPSPALPVNPVSGKRYKGANGLALMAEERDDPRWLTRQQALDAGAQVRSGEEGKTLTYWKFADESGEKLERPKMFQGVVFNAEQVDGLPPLKKQAQPDAAHAQSILLHSGAATHVGSQNRSFYSPHTDQISMQPLNHHGSANEYAASALHELAHWTGHPSRLARFDQLTPFGSDSYAREELRTVIASMILGDTLGVGHYPASHAGLAGQWAKALENDPAEICRAAADAENIVAYLLAFGQKQELEQASQPAPQQPKTVADLTARQFAEFRAADAAYQAELVRVYGEEKAADARYSRSHDDPAVQSAREAFHEKGMEWRKAVSEARETVARQTALHIPPSAEQGKEPDMQSTANQAGVFQTNENSPIAISENDASAARNLLALRLEGENSTSRSTYVIVHADDALRTHQNSDYAKIVALSSDWSGHAEVLGIPETEPSVFKVYARQNGGVPEWLADFQAEAQAHALADRLAVIDAYAIADRHEQAAAFAWIAERRLRENPESSDEAIIEAKEARKTADAAAFLAQAQKLYIDVPFRENAEAKKLGAKWDRARQSWFVPASVGKDAFSRWLRPEPLTKTPATAREAAARKRIWLAVPYDERTEAAAAGARWDRHAKSWYASKKADMQAVARWLPENAAHEQAPAMSPKEEFSAFLQNMGLVMTGEHPIMDGRRHRVQVEGSKNGTLDGSYIGFTDSHPAGQGLNFKTGEKENWKAKGYRMSAPQKAALQAAAAIKRDERDAELAAQHQATAERVSKQLSKLVRATCQTPYMALKGIDPATLALSGTPCVPYTDAKGEETFIPGYDTDGKLWTIQYIAGDGTKRFAKNSRKEGCFHAIGGMEGLEKAAAIVIAEGYATGASIAAATRFPVVVAFDSGNLSAVAQALHEKHPDKPIVIAGDDDAHVALMNGKNPGRAAAEAAAEKVGGRAVFPVFAPDARSWPANVPVVTPDAYRSHLMATQALQSDGADKLQPEEIDRLGKALLSPQQLAALGRMKKFTDFNDLAQKDAYAPAAIRRQISWGIEQALEPSQKHIQPQINLEPHKQQKEIRSHGMRSPR
ncbi:MAG: DUF5710 domain-containing protein [Azoarcus sp.]|jgi:antirestriction protein ArdC/phage/plasmid primase-like uncharacterized protein|nr:DUF5710 domain-containing protein [Azoarcus sp.]